MTPSGIFFLCCVCVGEGLGTILLHFLPNIIFFWLFGNFIQCILIALTSHFSKVHLLTLVLPSPVNLKNTANPIFVAHILIEHGQILSGQSLNDIWVLPHSLARSISCEEYTSLSLSQFSRNLFNDFLSGLFLFFGGLDRGGCHRSLEILSFSIITLQLLILLQKKLHCPNSHSSLDHGQSHHLFQPSTWIPSVSMEHRLQHDVQQRHGLWTSIQLPAAAQTSTWPLVAAQTMAIKMALDNSTGHRHHRRLWWLFLICN